MTIELFGMFVEYRNVDSLGGQGFESPSQVTSAWRARN